MSIVVHSNNFLIQDAIEASVALPPTPETDLEVPKAPNTLKFSISFARGQHFVRREYLIYGFDSLVADVGGYLGLLLGHSLLSIFYKAAEWGVVPKNCSCPRRPNNNS